MIIRVYVWIIRDYTIDEHVGHSCDVIISSEVHKSNISTVNNTIHRINPSSVHDTVLVKV